MQNDEQSLDKWREELAEAASAKGLDPAAVEQLLPASPTDDDRKFLLQVVAAAQIPDPDHWLEAFAEAGFARARTREMFTREVQMEYVPTCPPADLAAALDDFICYQHEQRDSLLRCGLPEEAFVGPVWLSQYLSGLYYEHVPAVAIPTVDELAPYLDAGVSWLPTLMRTLLAAPPDPAPGPVVVGYDPACPLHLPLARPLKFGVPYLREKVFNLKLEMLAAARDALTGDSDGDLWRTCLDLKEAQLPKEEAAACGLLGAAHLWAGHWGGGLYSVLLFIEACQLELTVPTATSLSRILAPLSCDDLPAPYRMLSLWVLNYVEALGRPEQKVLDEAYEFFIPHQPRRETVQAELRALLDEEDKNALVAVMVERKFQLQVEEHVDDLRERDEQRRAELAEADEQYAWRQLKDGRWEIAFNGVKRPFDDGRGSDQRAGLRYLDYILHHPGDDIYVFDLEIEVMGEWAECSRHIGQMDEADSTPMGWSSQSGGGYTKARSPKVWTEWSQEWDRLKKRRKELREEAEAFAADISAAKDADSQTWAEVLANDASGTQEELASVEAEIKQFEAAFFENFDKQRNVKDPDASNRRLAKCVGRGIKRAIKYLKDKGADKNLVKHLESKDMMSPYAPVHCYKPPPEIRWH